MLTLMLSSGAFAAGKHGGGHGAGNGEPGKPSEATRTIEIVMTENSFSPEAISVGKGQTIRFVARNRGEFVHEFNIGTPAMHAAHQKEMAKMFELGMLEVDKINRDKTSMGVTGGHGMAHNDPNSVLLEPGEAGEIVWKFSRQTTLEFA